MDQQNVQNSSGMMNGMPPQPQHEKKVGPIVGALIIVLVLIIAALYFFGQRLNTAPVQENIQPAQQVAPSNTGTAAVAPADDIDSLQADLNATLKDVDYSF